jgi:hypothetical protein
VATLTEIRENWSLRDIIEMNYVLGMISDAEAIATEKAEAEAKAKQ